MNRLLQRIERQDSERRLHGGVERLRVHVVAQQLGERLQRQLAQPLALHGAPLLEGGLADVEAIEQIAAIELGRPGQGLGRLADRRRLELDHVDADPRGIERQGVGPVHEDVGGHVPQRAAQPGQGLTERLPSLRLRRVAPEERGELVARVGTARRQREIGEQSLRLLHRQWARTIAIGVKREATEEVDSQWLHGPGSGHA